MNSPRSSFPDGAGSRLRTTLATIEREISLLHLARPATDDDSRAPPNGLSAAFSDLVQQLGLGPEPEVRECPVCKHIGMRAATVCGYCWTKLTPLTGPDGVAA